jgi:hypothetical protein
MNEFIGLGVAGNFANHLEQAGESRDFVNVQVEEENAPKGIFPFFIPYSVNKLLANNPLSSTHISFPKLNEGDNLQMEPEVALKCEIIYGEENDVQAIKPYAFGAYNDCSIRKEGAKKISEKKNWGSNTKGISDTFLTLDSFEHGGVMDTFRIASFLKREGQWHEYGEDSPTLGYNYFYTKLQSWIVGKLNNQHDHGPLENLSEHLKTANYPKELVISIGATAYTPYGESTFLEQGDEIVVFVYDENYYKNEELLNLLDQQNLDHISILHQSIV